jgi:Protein of unknown function (DUF3060)
MNPEDPEQYIGDQERGVGQTPGAAPLPPSSDSASPFGRPFSPPFGTSFSGQSGARGGGPTRGGDSRRRFRAAAKFAKTPPGLMLICAVALAFPIALLVGHYTSTTTAQGNLIMINSGAKDTLDCHDRSVKLDGDNNTYTITGHCRRLEVFGSANHVTVDSADIISAFGDDNVMVYHSGSPTINKTGSNNIVAQRSSIH